MPVKKLPEAKLIMEHSTQNPRQAIIEAAAKCWASIPRNGMITHLINVNHLGPFKFASFTFDLQGSRAFSHQRVRKQVGDEKLQESQRHVMYTGGFGFITPPTISDSPEALKIYSSIMDRIQEAYTYLVDLGIPGEDARFVLPNGCFTRLRVTCSMLSLIDEGKERLCSCAQWEYRGIFESIKAEVIKVDRVLGNVLQPKCKWLGYCPETVERSCGMTPLGTPPIMSELND